jgi:hypothetical protein
MPHTVAMTEPHETELPLRQYGKSSRPCGSEGSSFSTAGKINRRCILPLLEAMAGRYLGEDVPLNRAQRLELYLDNRLALYRTVHIRSARFIEPLFFDTRPEKERIGLLKSGDLLDLERKALHFTRQQDRQFRELREVHFRDFAAFLVYVDASLTTDD